MDEVIKLINGIDTEYMQDLLDAVRKRHRDLYPDWELVIISLPRKKPEEWEDRMKQALAMEQKCRLF